jgi:hypothetical protein
VRSIRLLPLALGLALTGCVTLTPPQAASLVEVRALVDGAAKSYGKRPVYVLVGNAVPGVGGTYRRGMMTLSTPMLLSRHRDSIVAHELGHYILGHEAALSGSSSLEQGREQELREMDANAKAVEILTRTGRTEAAALRLVYEHLLSFQRAMRAGNTVLPWGHRPPCDEIADLLGRFPAHRSWTAGLECAPSVLDANAAPR